jgi:hypothetical protein
MAEAEKGSDGSRKSLHTPTTGASWRPVHGIEVDTALKSDGPGDSTGHLAEIEMPDV